jgi:hypothetical protein
MFSYLLFDIVDFRKRSVGGGVFLRTGAYSLGFGYYGLILTG